MTQGIVGASEIGGRIYNYTAKYPTDKLGEEAKDDARVWKVYLDEAENYDMDTMQGHRNKLDSLLLVAALFSAVVTTFVAQTSQALQPDNAQILVSLIYENNQLLRAFGNSASVDAVPKATLSPGSVTHGSIDLWVNGFFFTSLALSIATVLLTVLAKQWIQAFTSIVPGDGRTRALVRHFRFQGMLDWKLGHIIESLPLILHGSVAIFLIGLSLYVSQRSHPISWVVASITIITFAAYLGTSILPAISIACPYRIPSIFPLAQAVKFALRITRYWFFKIFLRSDLARHPEWPVMSNDSLQTAEQNAVFRNQSDSYGPLDKVTWQLTCDILYWMFDHSSNQSVKEVVAEAVSGLLGEWKEFLAPTSPQGSSGISDTRKLLAHGIFPPAILIFLAKIVDMPPRPESFTEDTLRHDIWGRAIDILAKVSDSSDLVSMYGDHNKQLKNQIYDSIKQAYLAASRKGEHILAERLLHLGGPEMLKAAEEFLGKTLLHEVACEGTKEAILSLLKLYGNEIIQELDNEGWSAFHHAAENGKLDAIKTLVDAEPSIIPLKCHSGETALDIALRFGECQVARYLLDKGAEESPFALHAAVPHKNACDLVRILLEKGSNTDTGREEFGKTAMDIANELPPSDQRDSIIALLNEGTNVTLISKQSGGT